LDAAYAEVRILSGFGKGMLKCVIGIITPKSNLPSACAFSPDVEVQMMDCSFKNTHPKAQ
jgi:hypothetical protein